MPRDETDKSAEEFSRQADAPPPSLVRELVDFLRDNKKWWLAPIVVVLLLVAGLVVLSGTGLAPFIYTLW